MEGATVSLYKGLKGYWKRRGYERLNGTGQGRESKEESAAAGGSNNRRRRFWRIKISPKLKLSKLRFSPKKFLIGLRDAYVKMMLRIASSPVIGGGIGGYAGDGVCAFGRGPLKEYDEKMIVEIYRSVLMAQGQLVPREAAKLGAGIDCRR